MDGNFLKGFASNVREGIIGGVDKNEKTNEKKYYIFKCIYLYVWLGYPLKRSRINPD